MAIKEDMEKAYDRVEWSFVLKVMENFGFNSKWIKWVEQCISTTSFSILINGSPFGNFRRTRGIRQGDPLSPLLFITCSEVLSRLLLREESQGRLKGIKVGRAAPSITHLLFEDDLPLFGKATLREATRLEECISKYMAWLRQKVNREKSSVDFSKNFQGQQIIPILEQLQLRRLPSKAKHLGLPLLIPQAKVAVALEIKERFIQKITGWKAKMLYQAGRTMLIKTVAGAIPSYLLSYYSMSPSWCKEANREFKNFWWGHNVGKTRTLSLKALKHICTTKSDGGLGLRLPSEVNSALVAKLSWHMMTKKDCLWVRVLGSIFARAIIQGGGG